MDFTTIRNHPEKGAKIALRVWVGSSGRRRRELNLRNVPDVADDRCRSCLPDYNPYETWGRLDGTGRDAMSLISGRFRPNRPQVPSIVFERFATGHATDLPRAGPTTCHATIELRQLTTAIEKFRGGH
jgi:hypothetical protein